MKLQLNEETLNAYINEAIRQELEEANIFTKGAKAVGKGLKKAAKGTKNYFKALGGNKKSVKSLETELGKLRGELDDVVKKQKSLWGTANSGMEGHELVKQERGLRAAIERGEKALMQAKAGKTLARTATGAAAAAGVGGYLLGNQHGKNVGGGDPDAPWNDTPDDGGNETEPWDGSFPWDNTDPAWTPRPTRRPQPAPIQTPEPAQPETPARPEMPKLEPVALPAGLVQTGVTLPADQQPGIIGRPQTQPTFAQNAVGTMVKTAMANPADVSQREKNNGLRTIKRNAVRTINGDSYTGDKKADTKLVKDMYRTIRRGDQHPTL